MRRLATIALMLMAVTLPTGPGLGRAQSPSLSAPRLKASVEIDSRDAQRLARRVHRQKRMRSRLLQKPRPVRAEDADGMRLVDNKVRRVGSQPGQVGKVSVHAEQRLGHDELATSVR